MRFTIPLKLVSLIAVSVIVLVAAIGVQLVELHNRLWSDRQDLIRTHIESAIAVTDDYAQRAADGEVSTQEAQAAARAVLNSVRYGAGEYLFVLDTTGTMLMHPIKPELDGTDQMGTEDANGEPLFADMVKLATTKGAGMVEYLWSKPGSDVPVPKMSYVARQSDWNWIIGTGVYIDDLNAIFQAELWKSFGWLIGALVLLGGVCFSDHAFADPADRQDHAEHEESC